ncbi:hypothetical protein AACH06_25560 [Ideonella sp. DXS29W]|uniref:Uncharacterized protein n=1 Tax=Ideonella lacteola TaxID=2984193 RepID=A0ABU9BW59_9BURK
MSANLNRRSVAELIGIPLSKEQEHAVHAYLDTHLKAAKRLRLVALAAMMLVAQAFLLQWALPPDDFEVFRVAYRFVLPITAVMLAIALFTHRARLQLAHESLSEAKLLARALSSTTAMAMHIRWMTYLGPLGNSVLNFLATKSGHT